MFIIKVMQYYILSDVEIHIVGINGILHAQNNAVVAIVIDRLSNKVLS
jgi:hypothetical protein